MFNLEVIDGAGRVAGNVFYQHYEHKNGDEHTLSKNFLNGGGPLCVT